jgi:PAS domain S-box-containing protein
MHPLLRRQLAKAFGGNIPAELTAMLPLVNAAYRDADDDRAMFQRSLEVMSSELQERYDSLARQLQERERHLRILQAVHDAVLLVDDGARLVEVNDAALRVTGRPRSELVGRQLEEVFQIRVSQPTGPLDLRALAAAPGTCDEDVLVTRPDGGVRRCELTVVALDDPPEGQRQWIAVLRDATERRTLQNQLFQSHKLEAIGQLAAGVAHEINTPSQYVADNLRFLLEAFDLFSAEVYQDDKPVAEELEFLRLEVPSAIHQSLSGMERIGEIVRGIKTFSHPGTGTRVAADINQMLQTTATVARNEWKYVAEMELDLDPDLPVAYVFGDEIQHVFLNLVVNAAQAVSGNTGEKGAKGHIRVSSRCIGDAIEIRFADDGPGVPEVIRSRIFDPFFTTKPAGMGTGQGLAICHRIVEHHEGRLELEAHDGPGAIFLVRLPIAAPAAVAA